MTVQAIIIIHTLTVSMFSNLFSLSAVIYATDLRDITTVYWKKTRSYKIKKITTMKHVTNRLTDHSENLEKYIQMSIPDLESAIGSTKDNELIYLRSRRLWDKQP